MQLVKLLEGLDGIISASGALDGIEIENLFIDSRKKTVNSLFVCLRGEVVDAHNFIRQAENNGAVAILAEREVESKVPVIIVKDTRRVLGEISSIFYGEPTKKLKVIGITGTNGKTTTSYMLASILEKSGKRVGVIGTLGVVYGNKRIDSGLTTPDPIELQGYFAEMLNYGVEYVVMEVSAHALYYQKTAGVSFVACIFTNLTQDHLDFFLTMQAYQNAKALLFSKTVCPIAILNGDDEVGREFGKKREEEGGQTVYYGLRTPTDCFAVLTEQTLRKTECMFNLNDKLCRVRLRTTGLYNVYNALAAAACADALGIEEGIEEGLSSLQGVKGRLQRIPSYFNTEIFVDFAHTPDGLEQSLKALKIHCKGRLLCLFGCGGNRDKKKRPIMGERAARFADFSILSSDNPRYEDPLDIINEIEVGYRRFSSRYVIIPDRAKAIEYALDMLKDGDILLIAGKGGEGYQEIMGIRYPFDDQTMVEELIKRKGKKA